MNEWEKDKLEILQLQARLQAMCPHLNKDGSEAIRVLDESFPDRQTRGICPWCKAWITPKEWRLGAPDEQHPRGTYYMAEAHKDYDRVLALEWKATQEG